MSRLRLGVVHYLNAWPLAWGFFDGRAPAGIEPVFLPPAEVAEGMASGALDAGLLPSAELQRIPGLSVVSDRCISARHEVRSVLLVSRVPPAEIRRVALDRSSRTSAVLVQLLLRERWGIDPEVHAAAPALEAMLAAADAALLIGDPALAVPRDRYHVVDLAAEWRTLTGLPFVFAVWAAREASATPELAAALEASWQLGSSRLDEVVARAARELGLAPAVTRTYLTENLSYELGPPERASLGEFFARAHASGLLPAPSPLRFGTLARR